MERGSDKHGPQVDEKMKQETESLERGSPVEARAEESRQKEPPGDDQPASESRIHEPPEETEEPAGS
jgi:hypothetical protein